MSGADYPEGGMVSVAVPLEELAEVRGIPKKGHRWLAEDIYLVRVSGTGRECGRPLTDDQVEEAKHRRHKDNLILVRVRKEAKGILLPRYLYYVLQYLHQSGYWGQFVHGTAQQHLKISDVRAAPFGLQVYAQVAPTHARPYALRDQVVRGLPKVEAPHGWARHLVGRRIIGAWHEAPGQREIRLARHDERRRIEFELDTGTIVTVVGDGRDGGALQLLVPVGGSGAEEVLLEPLNYRDGNS